jgi:hypothetical protein
LGSFSWTAARSRWISSSGLSNLLELGFVDEKTLNAALSEKLMVPTLDEGVTDPMPAYDTLKLVPPELVRDYRVIPFREEGRRLHVLVEDPSNLQHLDDLAFRTGFIIKPYVAAEARIAFLLDRYYGIRRESRYLQLSADGAEISRAAIHETPDVEAASTGIDEANWDLGEIRKRSQNGVPAMPPGGEDLVSEDLHQALMATPPPEVRAWEMPEGAEGSGEAVAKENSMDDSREDAKEDVPDAPSDSDRGQTGPPEGDSPLPLEEALARLAVVKERDEVARALLEFARGRCRRAALFILQGGAFLGWKATVEGEAAEAAGALRFTAAEPSLLEVARGGRAHLVSVLPADAEAAVNAPLFAALGGGAPAAALVIPISVRDRVVNVLYADNGEGGEPPKDLGGFLTLADAIPHAFARLLRKRKAKVFATKE